MNPAHDSLTAASEMPMGRNADLARIPAHWMLARMGKKVLRPGGLELTRAMLAALAIGTNDDVVEFAPGLGVTTRMALKGNPATYIAVERDAAASRRVATLLAGVGRRCVTGDAQATGLPSACASVVFGEAMLTMQPPAARDRIVREAARLLRPGGRYGIHELALVPDSIDETCGEQIAQAFGAAIHHTVRPLTAAAWRQLLEEHGFRIEFSRAAPMHLLEPLRVVRDEGLLGAARFAFRVLTHKEARSRVRKLRALFRSYRNHVAALTLVATRKEGNA